MKNRMEWEKAVNNGQNKMEAWRIPYHFRNLCRDAPPLVHVLGNEDLLNREDNVAIIGARAADKDGLDVAYGLAKQMGE